MRKNLVGTVLTTAAALALLTTACQPQVIEVEKEVVVTQVVKEQVEVEKVVEVEVEKVVEVEVDKIVEVEVEKIVEVEAEGMVNPRYGGHLTVGFRSTMIDTGDMALTTGNPWQAGHIVETLIRKNPDDGGYYGGLASSWEIVDGGKSIVFNLRNDVTFHDGTPFNADAVKYNFDRIASHPDAEGKDAYTILGLPDKYKGTEVIDDYTVKVSYNDVYARMVEGQSNNDLGIASPTAMEEYGADYGTETIVGTGPFKFVSWTGGFGEQVFERNEDYNWAPAFYSHQGPAYLEGFTIKAMQEATTRSAAIESGSVDISNVAESDIIRLGEMDSLKSQILAKQGTSRKMGFSPESPYLKDIRVRQAIAHAIDRESMLKAPRYSGVGGVALAPLSVATWGGASNAAQFRAYNYWYDPEKSKLLLEEAGWTDDDGDGIRESHGVEGLADGTPLHLVDIALSEGIEDSAMIQAFLAEVGIETEPQILDWGVFLPRRISGDFDLQLFSHSGSSWFVIVPDYDSRHTKNFLGYYNSRVDELFDLAAGTANPDEQREHFSELQKIVLEELAVVPIVDWMYPWAMKNEVMDVTTDSNGIGVYLYDTWINANP